MRSGGAKANSGGARPGAGRTLPPTALEWRDFWRGKFNDAETRTWLWQLAKDQAEAGEPSLLCRLIDKTFPTPTEHSFIGALPVDGVFRVQFGETAVSPGAPGAIPVPGRDRRKAGT